jgi:hypothetical protein
MAERAAAALPPELEARLLAVEAVADERDFDAVSWFWMILLGAVLPAALIVAGWFCGPGAG